MNHIELKKFRPGPRTLRQLGFKQTPIRDKIDEDLDPQDIGDNGKSLMREWAKMDAEAEECRRNGAFSYRRD